MLSRLEFIRDEHAPAAARRSILASTWGVREGSTHVWFELATATGSAE